MGAWGNRLVRSSQTFGKNLDRVLDQNDLLSDIEDGFLENEGIRTKHGYFGPFTNTQIVDAGGRPDRATPLTLVKCEPGKAIIPESVYFTIQGAGTTENARGIEMLIGHFNERRLITTSSAGFVATEFPFSGVAAGKKYLIYQGNFKLRPSPMVFEDTDDIGDISIIGQDISLYFTDTINGGWNILKGMVIYREIDDFNLMYE